MLHLHHDYETLDTNPLTGIAVCVAYVAFDMDRFHDNPYTFTELINSIEYRKFDISEQKKLGWTISPDTVSFWKSQSPEVMKQVIPSDKDISISEFVSDLTDYVKKHEINLWWSTGNNFDCVFTRRLFEADNKELNPVLPYGGPRDFRTYMDTRFNFQPFDRKFLPLDKGELEIYKPHIAIHDVAVDILKMQKIEQEFHNG